MNREAPWLVFIFALGIFLFQVIALHIVARRATYSIRNSLTLAAIAAELFAAIGVFFRKLAH